MLPNLVVVVEVTVVVVVAVNARSLRTKVVWCDAETALRIVEALGGSERGERGSLGGSLPMSAAVPTLARSK